MDENKSCISCSYLEKERGQWYACSLHKEYIEDDSQAETCPDFRIAELEGKIDQLTAHSDIERQDDKSSNDTQTQTIVYGKESEE